MTVPAENSKVQDVELTVRGLRLAARVWGPAAGKPILALHGWLDNAATFDLLAPRFPEHRFVAVDCPGHGLSEHVPHCGGYNFPDWVPLPFDVADALGWTSFTLLGHSMGAAIASLAAGVLPERVEKLVLLDALGPLTAEDEMAPHSFRKHLESRKHVPRQPTIYPDLEAAAQRQKQAVPGLSLQGALRLVQRGTQPAPGGVTWRADPRLRLPASLRLTEGQLRAILRNIRAPVLLLEPQDGYQFDPQLMAGRKACIADLQLENPPGAHHVHLDSPDVVAPSIVNFLAKPGRSKNRNHR